MTRNHKADTIAVTYTGIKVRRSGKSFFFNEPTFATEESWTPTPHYADIATYFAGATGDVRAELILLNYDGIVVMDAITNGFRTLDPAAHLVTDQYQPIQAWDYRTKEGCFGTHVTYSADVDGNVAADAIAVNQRNVLVRRAQFTDYGGKCQ